MLAAAEIQASKDNVNKLASLSVSPLRLPLENIWGVLHGFDASGWDGV